jgi:hypothetical protein
LRAAVKAVSKENLESRIYAEYQDLKPVIKRFENGKADHNDESLTALFGKNSTSTVKRLERIGFIFRRTRNDVSM